MHRKRYTDRLGRALDQLGSPEPPPAGVAAFQVVFPVQPSRADALLVGYIGRAHATRFPASWPVAVAPETESDPIDSPAAPPRMAAWIPLAAEPAARWVEAASSTGFATGIQSRAPAPALSVGSPYVRHASRLATLPSAEPVAMPVGPVFEEQPSNWARGIVRMRFQLDTVDDTAAIVADAFEPPAMAGLLPGLAPTAAEAMPAAARERAALLTLPAIVHTFAKAGPRPAGFVRGPEPQAAETFLKLSGEPVALPNWRPAAPSITRLFPNPLMAPLADAIAAPAAAPVESLLPPPAIAAVAVPAPPARIPELSGIVTGSSIVTAGFVPGLAAIPAETLPESRVEPAAMPFCATMRLPRIGVIAPEVIPQAQAVPGLEPQAVESLPSAPRAAQHAVEFRPALRLPAGSLLRPAEDGLNALASPLVAAAPMPVETLPFAEPAAVLPTPATSSVVVQAFSPSLRTEFVSPAAPLPPAPIAPPEGERRPAALDPLSRIATPAGAHPERPVPAIPIPGIIPLEFHCLRIPTSLVTHAEPIPVEIRLILPEMTVAPALTRIELWQKRPRLIAFDEIFSKRARRDARAKRLNVGMLGKIAATVMVGVALWSGSRIAGLSQHSPSITAQVAASQRSVTVTESRGVDPAARDFGHGPVASVRRAIASRAATEITDTFHAGMAAWSADGALWAPGWKHHPQGYVSTGDMAIFRPSLRYADYRMEFYGNIEEKSMGWAVRAQDKKNYYAMKFTVIEAGLRPIIAMVHYNVANGKPGHKVQTPLSVMVHNNQPYHVAVDVRGNRFTASIEGETVGSWTDETLASGGVGFFSDAGEKARLYWMKLSRNQDWVGRFCAYLSGDGNPGQQTAELWNPEVPGAPVPSRREPDAVLAVAGFGLGALERKRLENIRRTDTWI